MRSWDRREIAALRSSRPDDSPLKSALAFLALKVATSSSISWMRRDFFINLLSTLLQNTSVLRLGLAVFPHDRIILIIL